MSLPPSRHAAQLAMAGACGVASYGAFVLGQDGLGGAAGLAAVVVAGVWAWRRWEGSRPLELAPVATWWLEPGGVVVRARVRLGRGRVAQAPAATVHVGGVSIPVVPLPPTVTGPWTVLAYLPGGAAPADVSVVATAREGEREWSTSAVYGGAEVVEGTFAPLLVTGRGGPRPASGWCALQPGPAFSAERSP